jgi:pimeloyl-ACP methyl ester carboxylesterase
MSTPEPESLFVQTNGIRLHYLAFGNAGPPLVIIHGNTHSGGTYAPLATRLASDFSVYAVDLRGHGLSDKPDSYSWTAFRDDVVGLIDQLDLRDAIMVAHSRGGGVTLLTAAARPGRVRGVVAYEPTLPAQIMVGMTDDAAEERARTLVARAERRRSNFPSREAMYEHFHGRGAFEHWQDEYLHAFVEHAAIDSEDGGVELASPTRIEALLYQAMVDTAPWRDMTPCPVPVLTVYGENSGRLGPSREPVAAIRALFPNTQMQVMQDATHSGPMEHPKVFERLIRDFAESLN